MKKFLVIGNPIGHSLSPRLHNFWIKNYNIDAVYEKMKLEDDEISSFIKKIKQEKIGGINVTIPFKKAVIPFLDKLSLEANKTRSVNTIVFKDDNLIGYNTDISGFTKAIKKLKFEMKGKKIFILGAGGVVPSIIYSLYEMKVSKIIISNRTRAKAEDLKKIFNQLQVIDWLNLPEFDVIINATSLGLKNEKIKLDFSNIGNEKLFYDIIYNPGETNFLKQGKSSGNLVENGKMMFLYQAADAFKLWHGIEPAITNTTLELINND